MGEPYPAKGGGPLRHWQDVNIMMKFGPVGVFYIFAKKPDSQIIPGIKPHHHYNLATPQYSIWEQLAEQFWWLYPGKFRRTTRRYTKVAKQELQKALEDFQPDIVLADIRAYNFIPIIKKYGCRFILEEHNVEMVVTEAFYAARAAIKDHKLKISAQISGIIDINRTKQAERKLLSQADQTWVFSEVDDKGLTEVYEKVRDTHLIPNGVNTDYYNTVRNGEYPKPEGWENTQRTILFPGTLSFPPNSLAVELLINQIYPQLRQVYPDCRLLVVGRYPTQWMLDAAEQDSGITVIGAVPDMRPYFAAASVMVVPLYHGSGTRLKILEAFAAGLPVVSTAKGAEGLKVTDGEQLLIREEIDAIAEGVRQVWSNPSLEQKLTSSAFELVQAEYSWSAIGTRVESAVVELF
ncbi:MAG: glycosyltransferase family 4 protein [Cyanobacteria bacterium P01_D01_bin.50]